MAKGKPKPISSWPEDERPRERLLKYGAASLSNAELLAIFLRVGVQGKNARQLASELLEELGGLRGLYAAGEDDLRQVKGLGTAKIAQIKAVIELSKRYLQEKLSQGELLDSPALALDFLAQDMQHLDYEVFKVVFLDNQRKLLQVCQLFRGSLNDTPVYPGEVIKLALKQRASSLILAHNHPHANSQPSERDCQTTRQLVWACQLVGICILDHLIIGGNSHFSFARQGLIKQYAQEGTLQLNQPTMADPPHISPGRTPG